MIRHKYLISFLSSILQTFLYSLLLSLAYLFWNAPNAGLIIGTVFPFLLLVFFVVVLIQNLIVMSVKNDNALIVFIIFDVILVLPFIINFTWLSPLLVLFNAFIFYIPFLIRKKYLVS